MSKKKGARKNAGQEKSDRVVFDFDGFEVEMVFDQPAEAKSGSGSLKNAWFDLTRPKNPPGTAPITNKPG